MAKNRIDETFTYQFSEEKFEQNDMFIVDNLMFEAIGGSRAYGVDNEDSDYDIVSVFMDRHQDLYPQNYGNVLGFDKDNARYEQREIKGKGNRILHKGIEVEGEWRSLTKFFQLAALQGSPNQVEILFVRKQCIKYIHPAFGVIVDNAHKFISMKSFMAFKGFMHAQFHRMAKRVKAGKSDNPTRQASFEKNGYDVKMAYHILRLMDILDQMMDGETRLDLMRNKDECKQMRNGEWGDWEEFKAKFNERFEAIELRANSGSAKLPSLKPRKEELRNILNNAIEEWYGTDTGTKVQQREFISADDIKAQLDRIESKL